MVAVFSIDPGWMSTAKTNYLADSDQGRRWTPWAPSRFGNEAHVSPARAAELVARLASGSADALSGRYLTISDVLEDLIAEQTKSRGAVYSVTLTPPHTTMPDSTTAASGDFTGARPRRVQQIA